MHGDNPRIIHERIPLAGVVELAQRGSGDMVKASVDIGRGIMALGGEPHADEEALLLQDGSRQSAVGGINIYPGESGDEWSEFFDIAAEPDLADYLRRYFLQFSVAARRDR